jgi:coenzyme F420-reducing hydrogenase delta subunit
MSKTIIEVGDEYMDFVYKFHNTLVDQKISLVYEGEVNQSITKVFTAMTEKNLTVSAENTKTTKRVYHVMVECLQNICKHTDDPITGDSVRPGSGIVMLGERDDCFTLTTGNTIANERIEEMSKMLDELNSLDKDEIKARYKTMIKESRLSEKAGAGLGFIDIIKKTGNKVEYHFERINDKISFFIFNTKIDRN